MRWKISNKFILGVLLLFLIIAGIGYLLLFRPEPQKKSIPVFILPHADIQWLPNLNHLVEASPKTSSVRKKSISQSNKRKLHFHYPLQISTCLPNKKTPDYVAKQLRRATGHEDDPCAKIKLDLNF